MVCLPYTETGDIDKQLYVIYWLKIYWQHMQLNVQMESVHFAIVVYSSESDNVTNLTFCLLPSPGWESLSASSPLYA